ncbi:alpha/beta hydrolase [Chelatococcus sp. SYSU_G07232]|uniref:Alpha/beta hydrolase n=1 Tax=Chelatococcus albus TaxID=3047466 RepID=A0ABT7AKB6_9HYPH|nr:alpha/beta fold hydrolase [Chelatococcus sp. SYSU_G07232]MDJ1159427.1 alpha/beta hydrolase [Chelatococcus sp. SYSU_G07232]
MPFDRAHTRRAALRLLALNGGALLLAGCGGGSAATGGLGRAVGGEADPSILAVTTRKPVRGAEERPWFGNERSGATRAVRVRFDPPPRSLVGRAAASVTGRWSVKRLETLGDTDPVAAISSLVAGGDVLIYVHGYNQTFETAVTDGADLADAIGFRGTTIAFSWPSKEGLLDYGYDRESALWSRDAFQDLIEALVRNAMVGRVHIVAHSMGTLLTLETLRQLWSASGSADVAARFGAIVLAAPDIDVDLFAASLQRIGPLVKHLTVISATNDRALAVSRQLAGGVTRTGAADRATLEALGVKVADASDYGWGILRHDLFLSNRDVRGVIKRAIELGG